MEYAEAKVKRQIWLNYFNQYLYEKGLITESERNKLKLRIQSNAK